VNAARAFAGVVLAACFVLVPVCAQSVAASDARTHHGWVGYVVPPYPSGWKEAGGACIGSVDDVADLCRHSIVEVIDAQSGIRMVLALEPVKSFSNPSLSRIAAVLEPEALFDPELAVSYGLCQLRGIDDRTVVALVHYDENEWLPAREAWRFDAAPGRFVPLPPAEVRCLNEGFGYDG